MAGGIEWFRWHHGSVTDPKFQLVARKSGQSLGNVIATWALLLEKASINGSARVAPSSFTEIDILLGMAPSQTERIAACLEDRGLIHGGKIVNPRRYFPATNLRPQTHRWRALRVMVFARDKFTCRYCGTVGGRLEADHVVPVRDGGDNSEDNVVTACMPCNRSKGAKTLKDCMP